MNKNKKSIEITGAFEHNLKHIDVQIPHELISVVTGVSGCGKSSLVFDTILKEAHRRFFGIISVHLRQQFSFAGRARVKSISGLSPVIYLPQSQAQPSVRASVATLTELGSMLGLLFSKYALRLCPYHRLQTTSISVDELVEHFYARHEGEIVAVCIPLAEEKKGQFRASFEKFFAKGFLRAFIDGKVQMLHPFPELNGDQRHTIKIIVDFVRIHPSSKERLIKSLEIATLEGDGTAECALADARGQLNLKHLVSLSTKQGCHLCGFSWPVLDQRHFSANSLGSCKTCAGRGILDETGDPCSNCQEVGIDPLYDFLTFQGRSILNCYSASLGELAFWLAKEASSGFLGEGPLLIIRQILKILDGLKELHLDHLSLKRRLSHLSAGELQRLRIGMLLNHRLRGITYILDEPSQGLHPAQIKEVFSALQRLKDQGSTVILVDHDPYFIKNADLIFDLGPQGGKKGGQLLGVFRPDQSADFAKVSETAAYLSRSTDPSHGLLASKTSQKPFELMDGMELEEVCFRHLRLDKVQFKKKCLNVISGVCGSGKTSLIVDLLYQEFKNGFKNQGVFYGNKKGWEEFSSICLIDRRPLGLSGLSCPATYLGIFGSIKKLYSLLPKALLWGYSYQSFSLQKDGLRCLDCRGKGSIVLSSKLAKDIEVVCPECRGFRYQKQIHDLVYREKSLVDVLAMNLEEAAEHFSHHKSICTPLRWACELGLSYLLLGQKTSSLSGGEAQRLKLAKELMARQPSNLLVLLDEPTRGLHIQDVEKLLKILNSLTKQGASILMIEHHQSCLSESEWIVDLGTASALDKNSRVLFQGPFSQFYQAADSLTAKYLFSL